MPEKVLFKEAFPKDFFRKTMQKKKERNSKRASAVTKFMTWKANESANESTKTHLSIRGAACDARTKTSRSRNVPRAENILLVPCKSLLVHWAIWATGGKEA